MCVKSLRSSWANQVIIGSNEFVDYKQGKERVAKLEPIEELSGKLAKQKKEDKLMHSVLENDKDTIDNGKLLGESINQNLSSFVPDLIFRNLVNDYKLAKQLYGEFIIRKLTGYDPRFVEKNLKIPEFDWQSFIVRFNLYASAVGLRRWGRGPLYRKPSI